MNIETIKNFIKDKWDIVPMPYKAGICAVIIIAVIFIVT